MAKESLFEMPKSKCMNHFQRWCDALMIDLGSIAKRKIKVNGHLMSMTLDRIEAIAAGRGSPPEEWEKRIFVDYIRNFPEYPRVEMCDVFPDPEQYERFQNLNDRRIERARSSGYHPQPPTTDQLIAMTAQARQGTEEESK